MGPPGHCSRVSGRRRPWSESRFTGFEDLPDWQPWRTDQPNPEGEIIEKGIVIVAPFHFPNAPRDLSIVNTGARIIDLVFGDGGTAGVGGGVHDSVTLALPRVADRPVGLAGGVAVVNLTFTSQWAALSESLVQVLR